MAEVSVVVTTRNRPALLGRALHSVLGQTGAAFDVLVVNDGTSGDQLPALEALRAALAGDARIAFLDLPPTPAGHGPYFALNAGVRATTGPFVAFLDDDDVWTDPAYLSTAAGIVADGPATPDLLFFDQSAVDGSGPVTRPIWLEDLGARLRATAPAAVCYEVGVPALLTAQGFCHVNTLVVRRVFFEAIGGFDDRLRYEGDRDFFLRGIDAASSIRYAPQVVARHHVNQGGSASTSIAQVAKRLDQFALLDKAARSARHAEIVAYARRHRRFALVRALQDAVAARSLRQAVRCLLRLPRLLG